MKNVISRVEQVENKVLKTADTITFEGAPAWKMSDAERLNQYAMTGVLGRTFYVSQKDIIDEAIDLIKRSDASDLAKAIVIGRNIGYIRAFPILGLVYLSMKDSDLFKKTFPLVIYTGDDLENFIDLTRKTRGFGRSIKSAINDWLKNKTNPYYALKYRKSIGDAIRLARPKDDNCIYSYILRGKTDSATDEKVQKAFDTYKEFSAFEEIPKLLEEGNYSKVRDNILEYRLDVDSLTAYYDKFDKTIWDAIAKNSPVMRFLKYLNKFERVGVDTYSYAKEKFTVDNLKRAKVFPFRLFTAWKNISSVNKVGDVLADVLDDYIEQYDWNKFNEKTWAICPDVSGSMNGTLGGYGSRSTLKYLDISAMFTGFLVKGVKDAIVLPWASSLKTYKIPKKDSVISHMNYISSLGGGGTNMNCALNYMMENNIARDYCVFVTDTESYNRKSYNGGSESWIETWIKYKKKFPLASAFIIRCDGYEQRPMSEEQCERYGIHQIFGWNDAVISYIQNVVENS